MSRDVPLQRPSSGPLLRQHPAANCLTATTQHGDASGVMGSVWPACELSERRVRGSSTAGCCGTEPPNKRALCALTAGRRAYRVGQQLRVQQTVLGSRCIDPVLLKSRTLRSARRRCQQQTDHNELKSGSNGTERPLRGPGPT